MSAFKWLKMLRKDERGNVLVVGAATMPLLMGSAALAVDTVQLTLWKRQLQRAADSAAIAAAFHIEQGGMDQAVLNDLDEHVDTDLALNEKPSLTQTLILPGSWGDDEIQAGVACEDRTVTGTCFNQAVQVQLTAQRTLPFMRMFTQTPSTIRAEATAALVAGGEYCMVSLYEEAGAGIKGTGNPNLDLECGIAANGPDAVSINFGGSATVVAEPVSSVGGIAAGRWFPNGTTLRPYTAPIKDPFKDLPSPPIPSDCSTGTISVGNNENRVMTADEVRCYKNWDIGNGGTLTLPPNSTIIVNDGLMDIKGTLIGENVTIYLTGDASQIKQNGGGIMNITAPDSGTYKGIAVYRDRTAANDSNKPVSFNGGAELQVTGAIYMPSTDISIGGNSAFSTQCLQVIGRILDFNGGGRITNACAGSGSSAIQHLVVRLVS